MVEFRIQRTVSSPRISIRELLPTLAGGRADRDRVDTTRGNSDGDTNWSQDPTEEANQSLDGEQYHQPRLEIEDRNK